MRGGSFKGESHLRAAILMLSLACLIVTLLYILSPLPAPTVARYWRTESIVLLGILSSLSLGVLFSKRPTPTMVILAVRLCVVMILGRPFGDSMAIKLPLWTSMFLECGGFLPLPLSLPAQGAVFLVILFSQGPILIWGEVQVAGMRAVELAAAAIYLLGLSVLLHLHRRSVSAIRMKSEQSERLDEAVRGLTLANLGFQKLASSAEERSADDERKRITREIHDSIGYALNNLIMMMEAATRLAAKDAYALRELLAQAREEAQTGLNETRKALRLLRGASQPQVHGLSAIHRLVSIFSSATGVEVKVDYCNADQSFGETIDLAVYRMVQEGMTNAFRHGHATLMRLHFWKDSSGVRVTLWDNGSAADGMKEGIGLSGMRERVERIGGHLRADTVPDGFQLSAWVPFAYAPAGERTVDGEQDNPGSG